MWWRKRVERRARPVLRCSFCNKHQDDVSELIAGPKVFICNECVAVCNDVLAENEQFEKRHGKKPRDNTSDRPTPWPNMIRCALRRTEINAGDGVVVGGNRGTVCFDCFSAVATAPATDR